VQIGEFGGLGQVGGEAQPSRLGVGGQQFGEPLLVEWRYAVAEHLALVGVGLHADHLVAQLGHRGGVGSAKMAAADHGNTHRGSCRRSRRAHRAVRPTKLLFLDGPIRAVSGI
jgi:hypothetical protein